MNAPNRNTLWAKIFVDELSRAGVQAACIAPGSRSTPLTLAFAEHAAITVYSLLDERGASFFGLGMALVSGIPVALLCTSGTATANFHPAVIEAYQSQIPLLVLTTDRPPELRDSGANQSIDQIKLYGNHVRWFVDVALPETNPTETTLRYLRTLAGRAVAKATAPAAGPIHLNFPFRKPLEPIAVPGDGQPTPVPGDGQPTPVSGNVPQRPTSYPLNGKADAHPFTQFTRGLLTPTAKQINMLLEAIQQAPRGLIVCGPRCPAGDFPPTVTRLAGLSGYPLLADALSGVRFGATRQPELSPILGNYETFLQTYAAQAWEPPQLVLQFGAMPTSKALGDYLSAWPDCRRIAVTSSGSWHDDSHTLSDLLWADPETTCQQVIERLEVTPIRPVDEVWLTTFHHAENVARQTFKAVSNKTFFEGTILADVVDLMPSKSVLYVGNSLPVRHLDQFAPPRDIDMQVLANRGASGIDGVISSALGAAAATDRPVLLVIGDVSFYHDLNALLALQRCGVKVTIVLINNDGGGIFHRLPIAHFEPPFNDLFVTPHGLDFEPVVKMFGANFVSTSTREAFRQALKTALQADISEVVEVKTDSTLHEHLRREIIKSTNLELKITPQTQ